MTIKSIVTKGVSILLALSAVVCISSCMEEKSMELSGKTVISADFSKPSNPPLFKKVAMYNAGCINPLEEQYDRDFSRIEELKSELFRIDLSIGKPGGTASQELVKRADDGTLSYDFSKLDFVVNKMQKYGNLPYMSWCYVPEPLQEDGKWYKVDTTNKNWRETWEEIYYQYAKHYLDSGVKIGYHEIYNEPDLEILKNWGVFDKNFIGFLDVANFTSGVYNDMYEFGAKGILRADPNATIGGPAFALGEIGVEDWTGFLPRVTSKKLPLDFYSFHTYLDGNTWFMSEEERKSGAQNELEKVVAGLSNDTYFMKTAIHLTEYSYLNGANGANDGINSEFNKYTAAAHTLSALDEIVNRTSVQWAFWAQFMESTVGDDPYGIIEHGDGNVKAAFNALKCYADMPVLRYTETVKGRDAENIKTYVSKESGKIAVLVWNIGGEYADIAVNVKGADFKAGERRVYRIDNEHASYFDGANPELAAEEIDNVKASGIIWQGTIPANAVVYITLKENSGEDFISARNLFANDIKTQYYYEDRFRGLSGSREYFSDYELGLCGSYAHYDRNNSKMYLGMGSSAGKDGKNIGEAHANACLTLNSLPSTFHITIEKEGRFRKINENTALFVRVDYFDNNNGTYTKSVVFHNGIYNEKRNPNAQDEKLASLTYYPWGTTSKPNQIVKVSGDAFDIVLEKYAPEGWTVESGIIQLSFDMQNTGKDTRATFTLSN